MTEKRENKERFLRKELPLFAFFFLLSFAIWYLNELSKDLHGTINYPVRYINPPKDRIITGSLPDKLEMELRGPGYSILKLKLSGSRAPVVIDFSKVAPRRIPGSQHHYYLVTSGLVTTISRQLHADFEILTIHPDTLSFGYDRLITRTVPVIANVQVEPSSGKRLELITSPDSVTITGPQLILDTLYGLHTRYRMVNYRHDNFRVRVPLQIPDQLQVTQRRVTVEVITNGRGGELSGEE